MSIAEKILALKADLDTVYEKGKEKAKQTFADAYQDNGQRTNYYQLFTQGGWTNDTFSYIRYPIVCSGGSTNASNVFARCLINNIDVPIIIEGTAAEQTFYYAQWTRTIADITFLNVPSFKNTFTGCSRLVHIGVKGSIDVNFSIAAAPDLDEESRRNITGCLKDLTGLTTQTLTFHKTAGEKLTEEQKAVITAKNWTLVY